MQNYTTIINIIALRQEQFPYDVVQRRCGVGSSTVTLIMKRLGSLGVSIEALRKMEPEKVEEAFYPPQNLRHKQTPYPDFAAIHERMIAMGKNADLSFLWEEYKQKNPDGYQLTQFYKLYNDYVRVNFGPAEASMPVERVPGERMYIDWKGDQPELLTDPQTGEIRKVHIFTTTLGFSSCVYAEVFLDEKLPNFIQGTVNALNYYGAVPKYLVPDNLKTAVLKHTKDELIPSSAYSDLEDFYGAVVLPPPPRKPKGKPTVERHVKFLEVYLVEKLKEGIYTSLDQINDETKKIVEAINAREFKKKSDIRVSRRDAFEKYDSPRMNQLPGEKYTLCDYKSFAKVPSNYHLEYDGHYYSVLYTYLDKPAILKATMTEIRICDANNHLICRHPRSYKTFPIYATTDSHMPPNHLFYKGVNQHDGSYYRRWAKAYGSSMETLIDRVLHSAKYEEQAYNSCAGILHSCTNVPHSVVEEASEKCLKSNTCGYSYFKKSLGTQRKERSEISSLTAGHLPVHHNIRGKEAFK